MSGPEGDLVGAPKEALSDRYEELRGQVLGVSREHGLGLAIFLGRGMAAWIEAWASCGSRVRPPEGQTRGPDDTGPVSLPAIFVAEVASVLAGMVLHHEEVKA